MTHLLEKNLACRTVYNYTMKPSQNALSPQPSDRWVEGTDIRYNYV